MWLEKSGETRNISHVVSLDPRPRQGNPVKQCGLLNTIRPETTSMKNNDLYQRAWHELESGGFDKALWARAFAEADGDENKAKAAYIRFRVAALTNEAREKAQQKAAEIARLRPEHLRAEILRRYSFLENDYPPTAIDEQVKSAVNSLSNTQWNNDPDKFIRAIIALDAALEATPLLKQKVFGTYLSDIVSEWQNRLRGEVSHQGDVSTASLRTSDTAAVKPAQDADASGNSSQRQEIPSSSFFTKLANGDYGLPRTYWLFGVLVGVIVGIAARTIESTAAVVIFVLVYAAYSVLVLMGVWQAASRYAGPKIWPVLAKIAVVLGALMLAVSLLLLQLINV